MIRGPALFSCIIRLSFSFCSSAYGARCAIVTALRRSQALKHPPMNPMRGSFDIGVVNMLRRWWARAILAPAIAAASAPAQTPGGQWWGVVVGVGQYERLDESLSLEG